MASSLLLIMLCLLVGTANAAVFECTNCSDCSAKIQNASIGDTVQLTTNLVWCAGHCIDFGGADNITFDGGGHLISGDDLYAGCGIYLPEHSDHNTIANFSVTDFRAGVYLYTSSYNTIHNITSSGNIADGIKLLYGSHNVFRDCDLKYNPHYDFYFVPDTTTDCDTCVDNVIGSGDRQIGFYNYTVNLSNTTFSALYLCNADGSTISNTTVSGHDTLKNNGIRMHYTDNTTLVNLTSSHNFDGISIVDADRTILSDVECNHSHHYNLFVSDSQHTRIDNASVCSSSQCGVYVLSSQDTVLTCIVASLNPIGIRLDRSSHTTINNSHITQNRLHGVLGWDVHHNLIYNNVFANDVDVTGTIHGTWNITNTSGENVIGGTRLGGNYWAAYNGTDTDHDGFGDTPWAISGGLDYLPLVAPVYICGDVDANGYISANDVVEVYRRAVDPMYELPVASCVADVDCNGFVSANDVVETYLGAVNPKYILSCSC